VRCSSVVCETQRSSVHEGTDPSGSGNLLKEKPRRRFQLLGGFKQEPAAHTLLALLVSFNFHWIDPQPDSQLLLGEPTEVPPDRNAFSDLNRQIAVEGGR
jgi:hypothetical protein